jgi:acetyl esterase
MPLDPEVAALLERQRGQPPRSSLTIEQTRESMRRNNALAGDPPRLSFIRDMRIAGTLPVRQYAESASAVVYFHGGRFISGDLESHDTLCRQLAAASGCSIVAVDYRLAPEHRFPAAVEDAVRSVAWALDAFGSVAVAGDSAGANLAAVAALEHRESVRCQALIYPMMYATCSMPSHREFATGYGPGTEDMQRGWREYLPEDADPRDPRVSPLFAEDTAAAPPALVITAEYDTLRDEGEMYARKLGAKLVRYDGAIHGFIGMSGSLSIARRAIAEVGAFLRTECSTNRRS